ncbi:MAG: hypothetical protein ABIK47_01390 [candidate division WOR-3 bacterium]
MGAVRGLVEKWRPPFYKSESEYKKDLYNYLVKNVKGIEVVREFGSSRLRADICVGRKVFIEIKKDLNSTSKLQRLLGQLELYAKEGWDNGILVVVGKVEPDLLRQAEEGLERFEDDFSFFTDEGWIIIRK